MLHTIPELISKIKRKLYNEKLKKEKITVQEAREIERKERKRVADNQKMSAMVKRPRYERKSIKVNST